MWSKKDKSKTDGQPVRSVCPANDRRQNETYLFSETSSILSHNVGVRLTECNKHGARSQIGEITENAVLPRT